MARLGRSRPFPPLIQRRRFALASAVLSGTITASTVAADIVAGGKTIILTLTGDTWVASGAAFDGQKQNIIDGLTSAQNELLGWNNVVKALQGTAGLTRTSDYVATLVLDAFATYSITAQETITATIPSTAVNLGLAIVAAPTFTVDTAAATDIIPLWQMVGMSGVQYYGLRI